VGNSSRRLDQVVDRAVRAAIVERVHDRVAGLPSDDFRDDSEVLAAVAEAR
jgi:hypothetical protein